MEQEGTTWGGSSTKVTWVGVLPLKVTSLMTSNTQIVRNSLSSSPQEVTGQLTSNLAELPTELKLDCETHSLKSFFLYFCTVASSRWGYQLCTQYFIVYRVHSVFDVRNLEVWNQDWCHQVRLRTIKHIRSLILPGITAASQSQKFSPLFSHPFSPLRNL